MQKLITTFSIVAFMLVATPMAQAQVEVDGVPGTTTNNSVSCLKATVKTREATLKTAVTTYNTSILKAYTERGEGLEDAYSQENSKNIKSSVKEVWGAFKKDIKDARTAWKNAKKGAWAEFKTDRKECRTERGVDDSANIGGEV
ncbi:hypothetical protein IPH92_00580 [Candidatus Kaiserbacteria bacterium]|nr:MAG: hypothetical protein IPH92_00580 [Candidatus Kaiserbacteria bacterium]